MTVGSFNVKILHKLRNVMMEVMEGNQRRRRPCREWLADIGDWCQKKIHTLSKMALDRGKWRQRIKFALETYRLVSNDDACYIQGV